MKVAPLFFKLRQTQQPVVVCQGGGDSTKTVSILQNLALKLAENRGKIATVTGVDLPNLKGGAIRAFDNYVMCDREIERQIQKHNRSENIYYYKNKSILEFKSFENEQDARGSERDWLYINECNGTPYNMFWQLQRKTRIQTFLDYNPTSRFWVHDKLIGGYGGGIIEMQFYGKVKLYITDHRHNPFLSKEDHDKYESISDPDLFKVYARGQTGKIKGLIFGHFKETESMPLDASLPIIWGVDIGYTSDPTAIIKIALPDWKKRIAKECSYEPDIKAEQCKNILELNGWKGEEIIYCENDPGFINQLRLLGLPAVPAIKGPGSVAAGISVVRGHDCYYTKDSVNFKKELETYSFLTAQDIISGKEMTTNVPIKGWDHCCDGFRYADYTDHFRNARQHE